MPLPWLSVPTTVTVLEVEIASAGYTGVGAMASCLMLDALKA
jgi:hypothetical protein